MERPKVSQGPDGERPGGCTKDLDLILWVMGNHWGLIHSNIEFLLVFHLGRAFQPFLFFFFLIRDPNSPGQCLLPSEEKHQPMQLSPRAQHSLHHLSTSFWHVSSGACTWVVLHFIACECLWSQNQEKEPGLALTKVLGPKAKIIKWCLLVPLRTSCLACKNPWKFATKWRCILQVTLMGSEQQFTNGGCWSVCGLSG